MLTSVTKDPFLLRIVTKLGNSVTIGIFWWGNVTISDNSVTRQQHLLGKYHKKIRAGLRGFFFLAIIGYHGNPLGLLPI